MRTGDLDRGAPAGLPASVPTGRTLVMGVLNVTPDSFSDGGAHLDPDAAIAHGLAMVDRGADLVDVGGESTRPGATPVDPAEEIRRVRPVVAALADASTPCTPPPPAQPSRPGRTSSTTSPPASTTPPSSVPPPRPAPCSSSSTAAVRPAR